ncbi:MAG: succinylglutamate desuccinylase/aspartoacylase family protein [Crocinitomicaceae bacterium]
MIINGQTIPKNRKTTIDIKIANLPSNTPIDLIAKVYRAKKDGPTLLVIGGVHGDEVNGIEVVKRAEQMKMFSNLIKGNVIAVPLLNIYGFINYSRGLPDGKDVNRSFPGSFNGSLASRVAYTLRKKILPHVDFSLDFHTGGKSIYNFPQARVYRDDKESIKLAEEFGVPLLIKTSLISKTLRRTAHKMDIPMIVFEGGESLRMDEFSIEEGLKGLQRVLIARGMVKGMPEESRQIVIENSTWLRASRSGMLKCLKISGEYVKEGDVLGTITGPYGNFEAKVRAKKDGLIYGHNNQPVVTRGDALFHIGFE